MIERLSKSKRNLAQRIKGFIDVIKAKTPDEKEFIKKLQKAENLFEKALERAGTGYILNNATKAQNLDNYNENLYNETNGELAEVSYSRKGKLGYNKTKRYIPSNKIGVDNWNYIDSQIQSIFKDVWQKLVSFRNKWYKIEKFSDMDFAYMIVERVPNSKFNAELEELRKYEQNNYADSLDQGLSEYENVRRDKSIDSTISNDRYSNRNISAMAQSGNSDTINGRQNSRQSNGNKQGNNRYSLKDNLGNELSEEQVEFFKDSKVRDENGNLLVVYHGTNSREEKNVWNSQYNWYDTEYKHFTVFKPNGETTGYFFADNYDNSGGYGSTVYKSYLNIKKPLLG